MLQINTKYLEQPQNQWVDHWKIKHQQTFVGWLKMKLNKIRVYVTKFLYFQKLLFKNSLHISIHPFHQIHLKIGKKQILNLKNHPVSLQRLIVDEILIKYNIHNRNRSTTPLPLVLY